MKFKIKYVFLDPEETSVDADGAYLAAAQFIESKGGPGSNWGRTLRVQSDDGEETLWAFIRESGDSGTLRQIDSKGNPIP